MPMIVVVMGMVFFIGVRHVLRGMVVRPFGRGVVVSMTAGAVRCGGGMVSVTLTRGQKVSIPGFVESGQPQQEADHGP